MMRQAFLSGRGVVDLKRVRGGWARAGKAPLLQGPWHQRVAEQRGGRVRGTAAQRTSPHPCSTGVAGGRRVW